MELAIELFGYLILTILGFVFPVMVILLSIYQEGMSKLAQQYQAEVSQSEENLKKIAKAKKTDVEAIQQSITELKTAQKRARKKLSYLYPRRQVIRLFIPLVLAFLGVITASILINTNVYYSLFTLIGLAGLVYALIVLWNLIGVIVEARGIIDAEKKTSETSITESLTSLVREIVDKTGQYFLKKVYLVLDNRSIKDETFSLTMESNVEREVSVSVRNSEPRMAKNIQIGMAFPPDFIIKKRDYYSIFRGGDEQIVRYALNEIHGNTLFHLYEPLIITPLAKGEFPVNTFIKAENIEAISRDITITVT